MSSVGMFTVWEGLVTVRQVSEAPRISGFDITTKEVSGVSLSIKVMFYDLLDKVARRVKPVAKAVVIAAAIAGLTKLADMVGSLGLDASTAGYVSALIAYAILELKGLEG